MTYLRLIVASLAAGLAAGIMLTFGRLVTTGVLPPHVVTAGIVGAVAWLCAICGAGHGRRRL